MRVKVVDCTDEPIRLIGMLAGVSHAKLDDGDETRKRRTWYCIDNRHDSVLEHVSVTFYVSGISRSCSHQLVRHRLASFVERSQRYAEPDFRGAWYVNPFADGPESEVFKSAMESAMRTYITLREMDVPPEDARFVLPEATKTDIAVTVNLRELDHMRDERCSDSAQWEIREVVEQMWMELAGVDEQWHKLLERLDGRREDARS